jgi:alkylhydroperoxidase family enzyme
MARIADTPDEARARVPAALEAWEYIRNEVLDGGIVDARLKRLCFRFLSGEHVEGGTERERLALRWAHAIAWDSSLADDELWAALRAEFGEPELVELGCAIGFALGQQHWERTLGFVPHAGLS